MDGGGEEWDFWLAMRLRVLDLRAERFAELRKTAISGVVVPCREDELGIDGGVTFGVGCSLLL